MRKRNYLILKEFLNPFKQVMMLYKDEQKGLDWISLVMGQMETAAELNPEYKDIAEAVSNSLLYLEEAAEFLKKPIR